MPGDQPGSTTFYPTTMWDATYGDMGNAWEAYPARQGFTGESGLV